MRAQDTIAEVSGLRIVTVRDHEMSECYTLFIMEPPGYTSLFVHSDRV